MKKLLPCIFILLTFACKKETGVKGATGDQGPAGGNGTGTDTLSLTGKVTTYTEFGARLTDQSGVTVTAYSGKDSVVAKSDPTGHYIFPGLARGTYDLSYSRSGYGTMKVFGYSHIPGGNTHLPIQDVAVTQIPDKLAVRDIQVTDNGSYNTIIVYLKASSNDYQVPYGNLLLLIGRDQNVSVSHYVYSWSQAFSPDPATGGYITYFGKSNLGGLFAQYDPLSYFACTFTRTVQSDSDARYTIDLGSEYYYVSPETGDFVYPNLSSATLVSRF